MTGYRHVQNRGNVGSVIAAVCFTLFIFSLAVVLVLNAGWLYELEIRSLDLEKTAGMSAEEIRLNYQALIAYNRFWHRGALAFPTLPMSESGRIHFQEVKRIFDAIQILCLAAGAASAAFLIRFKGRRRSDALRLAGILTLIFAAAVVVLSLVGWERFFVLFHQLVFRNDYWLFDPATDPVILILPDTYFLHCAAGIWLLAVLGGVICLLLSGRRRKRWT